MVDIHSHILYGLDDGAETLEESVAMVRMAAAQGTTDIVASPHANHSYRYIPELVEARAAEVRAASGDCLRIHRGCDFHLSFDNIQDAIGNPAKYTIGGGRYLLVEFSDLLVPKTTDDVFTEMQRQGVVPVITHPERNPILQGRIEQLQRWVESGVTLQVTADSLIGRFGKSAKKAADELMARNLVHFIASDAHDTRHRTPDMREARTEVERVYGAGRARLLFVDNPHAAVESRAVTLDSAIDPAAAGSRPWWRVW